MTAPSRDEFEIWLADPVTVFVLEGLKRLADAQFAKYQDEAWNCPADPDSWQALRVYRERFKARIETNRDLAAITIEDAYGANGLVAPPKEPA